MRYRTVAGRGVVVLLLGHLFSGISGLVAAETPGRLPPEAMAGQVVDPAGKPAAGATVWLVGGPYDDDAKSLDKTTTDANGRFLFPRAKMHYPQPRAKRPHLVVRDLEGRLGGESNCWAWGGRQSTPMQILRIKLVEVRDYRGHLLDASGKPIAKAIIRPQSIAFAPLGEHASGGVELPPELVENLGTETGADGTFTLRRVPIGGGVISRVAATGFGSPRVAWNLKSPVTLRLDRVGSVRGTLAAPTGAAELDALQLSLWVGTDSAKAKGADFRVFGSAETRPGKDGKFQFDGVSPGSGHLSVSLFESALPYYTERQSVAVTVKPGETMAVEVKLLPAVAVRGQVVDAVSGNGIAGVAIEANRVSEQGQALSWRRTKTDAEGRFVAYTPPGKIMAYVAEAPDGYVLPNRRGESFKMDATRDVTWPTIKLEPAARLEAIVVDESGKPVPDAEVQFLVLREMHDLSFARTDASGRCSVGGLNAKEFLAVRARTETAVSDVLQIRPAEAKGPVRLALSPAKVFSIRGACVDAAGRPIRQAKASVSTSWMLGPSGLGFGVASCETDAEGRFEARTLWPGFQYHVSASAEGYDKFESKPFQSKPGEVHDVGRLTLVATGGSVEGIVVDSTGRPIAGARVFNSGDAPKVLSTQTDTAGRFRLEGFRMGPVFVFAEKAGYRFTGVVTESRTDLKSVPRGEIAGVEIAMLRSDEPVPPWKPKRAPLSFAEQQKVVRRLLEKFWATRPHGRTARTVEFMARIDPEQALKWSAELGGRYDDLVWRVAAERDDVADAEETLALFVKQPDGRAYLTLKSLAERHATSDPQKALRFAEEMIQRAKRLDQPQRTWSLAIAGTLVAKLGKAEAGRKLVEEAADMVAKMGTDGLQGFARGLVATALAPFDFARAMGLAETLGSKNERDRALARIAAAIAPKDLNKALEIIGRLDKRSTLPDLARTQIAYELVATRREDAMRVVEGMETHGAAKMKAEALGWMAVAVAPRDRQFAHSLIDKSMAIYWGQAQEFLTWSNFGSRATFAAFVVAQANEVGHPDMGLLVNRVLAMRPAGAEVWSARDPQQALILTATILAMVDRECARQVLLAAVGQQPPAEGAAAVMENLDLLQAWALIDLDYTVKLMESRVDAAKGNDFWTNYLVHTLDLVTTPPDRRAEIMLRHSGGRWFPGTEL